MNAKGNGWDASLKPLLEISEVNRHALEKLATLQTECFAELMETNLKQLQTLLGSSPQAVGSLQMHYFRELESRLQQTAEKELSTLAEARQAVEEIMERSYQHHRQFLNQVYPNPDQI